MNERKIHDFDLEEWIRPFESEIFRVDYPKDEVCKVYPWYSSKFLHFWFETIYNPQRWVELSESYVLYFDGRKGYKMKASEVESQQQIDEMSLVQLTRIKPAISYDGSLCVLQAKLPSGRQLQRSPLMWQDLESGEFFWEIVAPDTSYVLSKLDFRYILSPPYMG
ncbi:MAG: hypothetical protein Q7S88_02815 [Candidatus Daviesbacteria bacterium]|nr:hypothetical protein [Candidatus Daviesbacteria bacterium]